MPKFWLILVCSLLLAPVPPARAAEEQPFAAVDLDRWIRDSQPVVKGLPIINPKKVVFKARLATIPEPGKSEYLRRTLVGLGVNPLPSVSHQASVISPGGARLRLYVEDGVAARLKAVKRDSWLKLYGYHVYATEKGPAILLSDFESLPVWRGWLEPVLSRYRAAIDAQVPARNAPPANASAS
jgi:hypothetical protein